MTTFIMSPEDMKVDNVLEWFDVDKMRDNEKDKWGEVFTPVRLIEELLEHIPAKVWTDPSLRWLDPAAGTGHFGGLIFLKLMQTLSPSMPDSRHRAHHILKNMLFMVELNPSNVAVLRRRFGASANVFEGDFLQSRTLWFLPDRHHHPPFDVIVGNPPYQSTNALHVYKGSQGRRTLWNRFVQQCLDPLWLSRPSGYLAFITPAVWRRPESALYSLMTRENTLRFLHIYGEKDGRDIFGVQTRFDVYVIQTRKVVADGTTKSIIIDAENVEHRDLDISKWPFLPNAAFDEIRHLLVSKAPGGRGIPVLFHSNTFDARRLHPNKTAKYRYPIVHNQTRRGLGILYADHMSAMSKAPKVVLNFNRSLYPYNDHRGEYGLSQLSFGLPLTASTHEKRKAEGEALIRGLTSPTFQHIVRSTKWTSFQTDYRMFRYFDAKKISAL